MSLGQELTAAGEAFQIKELVFDQAMHGLHIALIGVRGGRDARVLTGSERSRKARTSALRIVTADELGTVVGLPGQIA